MGNRSRGVITTEDSFIRGAALQERVQAVGELARSPGHLQPIATESLDVCDGDLPFQLRVVTNLARKSRARRERIGQDPVTGDFNPFLPWDSTLEVEESTPRYRCLLNRVNVVDQHIPPVTTACAEQCEPLHVEDFSGAAIALQARDGRVFFNGGSTAGASVRRRHLQMIPLPLCADHPCPLAPQLTSSAPAAGRTGPLRRLACAAPAQPGFGALRRSDRRHHPLR